MQNFLSRAQPLYSGMRPTMLLACQGKRVGREMAGRLKLLEGHFVGNF